MTLRLRVVTTFSPIAALRVAIFVVNMSTSCARCVTLRSRPVWSWKPFEPIWMRG